MIETLQDDTDTAVYKLRQLIARIKQQPGNGFVHQQVSKIIHDSKKFCNYTMTLLMNSRLTLPPADQGLVDDAIRRVRRIVGHLGQNDYHKRLEIQVCLKSLNANLLALHENSAPIDESVVKLSRSLYTLTNPSYAETTDIDKIIYELECYVYWRSFLPYYFPGYVLENPKVSLAKHMIEELKALKDMKGNLLQVKQILEKASRGFARSDSLKELSWMQQLLFKSDYLNTLILKHLEKVVSITSIFSHPLQDDPTQHLGHSG